MPNPLPLLLLALALTGDTAAGHTACLEYGLDYVGDDMSDGDDPTAGTVTDVQSAEDCQKLCQGRAGCKHFSWAPPTDVSCPDCRLKCWLKTGNSKKQVAKFRISGPAKCQKNEKLIFQEEFDSLDENRWLHDVTGARGSYKAFQYLRNNRQNSYVEDGKLFIKPSFTATEFGEDLVHNGTLNLDEQGCTGDCQISAGADIVNPIQSASMHTSQSFSFRYGRLEVSAKMPRGDWLQPTFYLISQDKKYGRFPTSGQIQLIDFTANSDLTCSGKHVGNQLTSCIMSWGTSSTGRYIWDATTWSRKNATDPYSESFHKYELEWSDSYIAYKVDGVFIGAIRPSNGGFWQLGGFHGDNPWAAGNRMAPFDQNFYILFRLSVGGDYFDEGCSNGDNGAKPWTNKSPTAMRKFWEAREDWEKTWGGEGSDQSALQIDYIRVYQRV